MKQEELFEQRLKEHYDELKWLYCELYGSMDMFYRLCRTMKDFFVRRKDSLKQLDEERLENPGWYKGNSLLGMMMYTDAFAGSLKGVQKKLDYIQECNVNCLHLMPLLQMPETDNDGGYAVSDYTRVDSRLGTMADLSRLTDACRKKGICVCLDFVMNHTSMEHEWARRARAGEKEYQDRYFFFDDFDIPARYEKTCPQVFPTTAPGNFTWLEDIGKYVMTTFYPYQWDLNYRNPAVFNDMTGYLLNLANHGIDILRIDAVPYIWKELGTSCRNLPQVHTIVRMLRMICEIVCPGVLLLGEVVMAPDKVVPYFGTLEKPECHMLYNVTTMATLWHTAAVKDAALLKRQTEIVAALPKDYVFLNYIRCHDDIGWGLEYGWLKERHMEENPHKKFLNDYFTGKYPGSLSRGELYNDDPSSGDARLCGTAASLCGIEAACESKNPEDLQKALSLDLLLHGYMMSLSGIPMIYSGDEVARLNDYTYHEDPKKADDSRYIHRGPFLWEEATLRHTPGTIQQRIFEGLEKMETLRKELEVFSQESSLSLKETWDSSVLCLCRQGGGQYLVSLFNFSDQPKTAWIKEEGVYQELLTGQKQEARDVLLAPYEMKWMLRKG
ncbi:MAG: Beta-galactosidase C-terminal domain [Lachnospiraceae bacterium]|uniref:Beta-galactosidase C-terminal domain n=1 Tax=Candidatus Enterocloster excrementigallinarum TaxID=2838558 RepID=A0A9D2TF09_9FIRM|nr:Beta-galactosidase C-terminal domain [Lachnospiraceae bacterium]HJC66117.1 Beta-galactosidase C-terminal domain [Candidatus Enterocloster excrementigallinarum]